MTKKQLYMYTVKHKKLALGSNQILIETQHRLYSVIQNTSSGFYYAFLHTGLFSLVNR